MARVLWRLLPSLIVLIAVLRGQLLLLAVRCAAFVALRLVHLFVLATGAVIFWSILRSYQLSHEQEIYESALLKHRFYEKYRRAKPTAARGSSVGDAGTDLNETTYQLKAAKRLPIPTHLRTSWSLAPEICDEITAFVNLAVRDYVNYWFQPISMNEDFPQDIKFLLADIMGAMVSRVLEMDSSQALIMAAKSVELLRLHLGWFRETFAQLSEEHPAIFQGDESDDNLQRRQELVAAYVQTAKFLHPGCANAGKKSGSTADTPEAIYLRHVATQLLIQLKPELGQQSTSNLFVSIAMNLMRESLAFKALKPTFEYSQPRYANELIIAALQSVEDEALPTSPTATAPASGNVPLSSPTQNGLRSIRMTTSFLYRASKRSSEQAEAALQAVFDVVSSAASTAASGISSVGGFPTSPTSTYDGGDYWSEASALGVTSPRSPGTNDILPLSPPPLPPSASQSAPSSATGDKKAGHFSSIFSLDDRISFPKTVRIIPPRAPSSSPPPQEANATTHMDDLKNMKANLESSLKSSLFKVNKTFKNLGGHLQEPFQTPLSVPSTAQAANLMKRPGKLFQKALRRSDPAVDTASPSIVGEFPSTPPPLTARGNDSGQTALRSPTQPLPSPVATPPEAAVTPPSKETADTQDRVLTVLEKAISHYIKMHHERPEMRSSARSRELYELLSALEDLFMLGYRKPGEEDEAEIDALPPMVDPSQLYWNYLAQDRPETPFLNDQWRFIQQHCPVCGDSDSFYSTRGIQWILIALEKGLLWEYFTALNLNRKLTELFYDDSAVLRQGKRMEQVLRSLFPLTKIRVALEVPHLLGRVGEMDKELDTVVRSSGNAAVLVVETAWEVERYVPLQGWVKSQDKRPKELPSSEWIWENEWTLEGATQAQPPPPRRASNDPGSSDADSQTWEYGKISLDHRFHDKEKKLDSVRRRKWTRRRRQLPLVLSTACSTALAQPIVPSEPAASTAGRDSISSLPSPKKKRAKARAMLTKRRSFSLDKLSGASDLAEAVASPQSKLGLRWRRAKRNPASPLARTTSAYPQSDGTSSMAGQAANGGDVGFVASEGEDDESDDEDDQDVECFRCSKTLARQAPSFVCQSCSQRVCAACHQFFAFLLYPPPLESTKKEQVCGSCYDRFVARYKVKVDAHVGKYFIKDKEKDRERDPPEDGNGPPAVASPTASSSGSAGPSVAAADSDSSSHRFEVTVQLRDESPYAWSVVKTFHEFEGLEKQLYEKLKKQEKKHGAASCRHRHWKGVDYSEILSIEPSLKKYAAVSLPYDKKLLVLETFLQRLLACDTLCQSSVLHHFLLLGDRRVSFSGGAFSPITQAVETSSGGGSGGVLSPTTTGPVPASSPMVMVENGKWKRGRWVAPDPNSKETKMKVLQQLEVALFAVLNEVFEFDGIGIVRRHLFSMTRSFIRAFLSASHFRKLETQYLTFTDPKKMAASLLQFRLYMFPDAPVPLPPAQLSAAEMRALRKQSLDAILASFPSTIVSVFGENSSANAALKLHEFVQHEVFVKNLMFSMCDELLPHVFPDVAPFKAPATASGSSKTAKR